MGEAIHDADVAGTSSGGTSPVKVTLSAKPSSRTRASSCGRNEPSPTKRRCAFGHCGKIF